MMSKVPDNKKILYFVARTSNTSNPENLCIYAYGTQVQYGNMEDATSLLTYVNSKNSQEDPEQYAIYRLVPQKI
jgi:hypothetical protein